MAKFSETSNAKKGGLFVGDSHAEGGIPAIVTDTGQPIEVEGGEAIINKKATALHWEELSKINQSAGGGVPIPPPDDADKVLEKYNQGGKITNKEKKVVFDKWKKLVNMTFTELSRYYHSKEGKESGLSEAEAKEQGISSGRESAEWILKMKKTNWKKWTDDMWKWANKQISFISRMSGLQGDLTDEKGKKTRKYKALMIWGNNPKKKNAVSFKTGNLISSSRWKPEHIKQLKPINLDTNDVHYKTGGDIPKRSNTYAFVTSTSTTGKRLFKVFDHIPTNKEVYDYYQQVNKKIGTPIEIVDSSISIEVLHGFDRENFLKLLNKVALIQFSSKIKDIKDLMFSFDYKTFNVYEFEAELNYGRIVKVKMVDGVIFLEDKYEKGGELLKRKDGSYSEKGLWDNIRENIGSGKEPTPEMLEQEKLIKQKYHLGGNMSKHLAPNSEPSNLTHEQWHLVRTPEFKAWFGDWEKSPETASKVVDENGEPLPVYHGQSKFYYSYDENNKWNQYENEKINVFDKSLRRFTHAEIGFYFSDKQTAKEYADNNGYVYEVFLKIMNPLINKDGVDFNINNKILDSRKLDKNDYNLLLVNNIDGLISFFNYGNYTRLNEIVAFEPNQIKLADGTNTTFDSNNPDIRFETGGAVQSSQLKNIKESYDFGSEYFDGVIYGQKYKIRMNKNHPRNSSRNDDQSIHNLSLVNVDYPSSKIFRESNNKLQWQLDKIYNWEDAEEQIIEFFFEIKARQEEYKTGGAVQKSSPDTYENKLLQIRVIGGENSYYKRINQEWKFLSSKELELLKDGTKHELEHIETIEAFKRKDIPSNIVASFIAFDHINETPDYYKKLEQAIPEKMEQGKKIDSENKKIKFAFDYSKKELEKHITDKELDDFVKNSKFNSTAMAYNYPIPRRSGQDWHLFIRIDKPSRMGRLHNDYWVYLYKNTDQGADEFLLKKSFETLKEAKTFVGLNYYFETQRIYDVLEMETPMEQGKKTETKKYSVAKLKEETYQYLKKKEIKNLYFEVDDLSNDEVEIYHIEPSPVTDTQNKNLAGMQILWNSKEDVFEVSEYSAGNNSDELWVFGTYKNLSSAIDSLLKGNSETGRKKSPLYDENGILLSSIDQSKEINPIPLAQTATTPMESPKETPETANPTGLVTNNWNEIPVRWKNVKAVRPVTFSINPFDKGLQSIVKVFTGDDQLRPIMSGIRFEEKGLVVTDAHKLLHISYKHSDFIGNYPSLNSQKAYGKYTSPEDIQKQLNEAKFPNWEAVIPKDSEYVYEFDTLKLYQYCKVAANYANKTTNQVAFKYDNKSIGFNVKFLIDSLEAMMKIQKATKLYIHLTEPSRAAILSFDKSFSVISSTYTLLMPVMLWRGASPKYDAISQIYGASDIDLNKSIGCYFDFTDNNIHNANGTIADYKESYGDSGGLPLDIITMMDRFIKIGKTRLPILENVLVDGNGIRVDSLDSRIEIANDWDIPQGIYSISNNALVKSGMNANIEDFPRITKRVPTSNETFSINADIFKFYIEKAANHISNDDLRPVMNGICFESVNSQLSIVSTDSHTLFHADLSKYATNYSHNFSYIIPDIKQVLNFCKNIESEEVKFYVDNLNPVNFRIGAGRIHFEGRLEDGKYPNWRAIVPQTFSNQLIFDLKDMYNCLNNEMAKSFSKEVDNNAKNLTIFNQSNKIFISETQDKNKPDNAKTKEICEIKITKKELSESSEFNIGSNFVLLMPVMNTNGTYFNFNVGKFNNVISTIGKEKVIIDYNTLSSVYIFTSDNLDYKTSDAYKPTKVDKPVSAKTKYVGRPSNREKTMAAIERNPPVALKETKPTFSSDAIKLIPNHQMKVLKSTNFSEMEDVISRLNSVAKVLPKLYGQDGVKDKMIYLHYFYSNQDWFVTELDQSTGECFGYADLGYGAELGYMSIPEFVSNGKVELDFYFEPKRWSAIAKPEESAFEKQNKAVKPLAEKPKSSSPKFKNSKEESTFLEDKWRNYLSKNVVDSNSRKLQKDLFEFNKKHFPVLLKLDKYKDPLTNKVIEFGEVNFSNISGWIDSSPFTKVVDGKIVNNDLGNKIGRKKSFGGGSAFMNFTPTMENAQIIKKVYENLGYKVEINNELPKSDEKINKEEKEIIDLGNSFTIEVEKLFYTDGTFTYGASLFYNSELFKFFVSIPNETKESALQNIYNYLKTLSSGKAHIDHPRKGQTLVFYKDRSNREMKRVFDGSNSLKEANKFINDIEKVSGNIQKTPLAKTTEKVLGTEYKVGTKGHAKAVAQKKQFDDLNKSESGISDDSELKDAVRGLEAFMKTTSDATEKSQLKQAINGLKALLK